MTDVERMEMASVAAHNVWMAAKIEKIEKLHALLHRVGEHFKSCGDCLECVDECDPTLRDALAKEGVST